MKNLDAFGFGVIAGVVISAAFGWFLGGDHDRDEEKNRFFALQACISNNQCRMTVGDFSEYYDLKYKLMQEDSDD